jgi:Zn-dependent alcohol dehydrogenase
MDWLRERVWQLGIAIVLALIGAALMYLGITDGETVALSAVGLVGLAAFLVAIAIPLVSKAIKAAQEAQDQDA